MELPKTLLMVVVLVVLVAGVVGYFVVLPQVSSPAASCGNKTLVLLSHSISGNELFTTWYNCQDTPATFYAIGEVWSQATDQTNELASPTAVSIRPHQTTSVLSTIDMYNLEGITQITVWAVNSTSVANVFSPVYTYYS